MSDTSTQIQFRKYQSTIAEKCINKNSLVVLPTGLGKTIIAVLVASKTLDLFPSNNKIIVLAPTRPLINQHYETFHKFLKIYEENSSILTGKVAPEKRTQLFLENQFLFYTPQTLRNDLVNQKYDLTNVSLIIFDEAHHSTGDYPYTLIGDKYIDQNPDGTILALTASPGASKNKITELCKSLHIPVENIHIRTRKDLDVKTYIKPMDIYKVSVNMTYLMRDVYMAINEILEERLQYLSQVNFLEKKSGPLYKKIIRKDLLRLNKGLVSILHSNGDKTGVYSALSINAQGLILYHMIELVEQQGLDVLLQYLEKVNKDAKKRTSSKAIKVLASDHRLRNIYLELKKNKDFSPEDLTHPKYPVLVKIILEELKRNPKARILVFVKLRDSIKNIAKKLGMYDDIKAIRFVGQTTKSEDDKGLSQKRQIEILNEFKQGIYNVLVSTNVGEEGLDIAECDLVIFYDVVASEIRLIQRKGRTARHREGKVIILYCNGTHDEVYLRIALSKLKRMNINLKRPSQLKVYYDQENNKEAELEVPDEIERISATPKGKPIKRQYQSKLVTFINSTPDQQQLPQEKNISNIRISRNLSPSFGLRKKLQGDNIEFQIVGSDLHIILYNKVLIQIFEPKNCSLEDLLSEIEELKQISKLLIIVFDFIDYKEDFEGEKRILKRKFLEFANNNSLHIINVDNPEELYFIVKNIYENPQGEKI